MSLIKWPGSYMEPFGDWDKFFDQFHKGAISSFTPAMDVYEKGNDLIVEAQLPGIDPNKVEVAVENDVLTIKGSSEKKKEVDEKNYYRKEIHAGSFYRSMVLPAHVQGDKAKAEFEDGVLKVSVPKLKTTATKKIDVKVRKKTKE